MTRKSYEIKAIRLADNQFLRGLVDRGMVYEGYDPEITVIKVAACEGFFEDWTAYFETPYTPFHNVLDYGNKLPKQIAEELFPEWAKKNFKWRA